MSNSIRIVFVSLILLAFNNVASAYGPRLGYVPSGTSCAFKYVCNCGAQPTHSICGGDPQNACGCGYSCDQVCKHNFCSDPECFADKNGKLAGAAFFCNTNNQAVNYWNNQGMNLVSSTQCTTSSVSK